MSKPEGFVYVIRFGEYVKIGFSGAPLSRMKSLQFASGTLGPPRTEEAPVPIAAVPGDSRTEHMLHVAFHNYRAVGEYFWYRGPVQEWCDRLLLEGADLGVFNPPPPPPPEPPMPEIQYVYVRCTAEHVDDVTVSPAELEESEQKPYFAPVEF